MAKNPRTRTTDIRTNQQVGYSPIYYPTDTNYGSGTPLVEPVGGPMTGYTEGYVAPDPISGGGGGGGGGVAPYDPTTDPTYQAYIASLDLSQAQQQAETARRQAVLGAQRDLLLGESGRQGGIQQENIGGGFEARGLYNSGARLQDQARAQANQAYRENQIRGNTANQVSDLEATLQNALAQMQLKRQNATQGIFQ